MRLNGINQIWIVTFFQTTYENFRYRADSRSSVYNQGCLNNFLEVFCSKVKPSKNNFRALVQEEVPVPPAPPPLPPMGATEHDDLGGDPRSKVEDDLDIGEDLLKISQRRDIEDINEDIRSRGSTGPQLNVSEANSSLGSDHRAPTIRSEARHSSWGRRSGSWDIASEVLANANVTESRAYITSKETRQ